MLPQLTVSKSKLIDLITTCYFSIYLMLTFLYLFVSKGDKQILTFILILYAFPSVILIKKKITINLDLAIIAWIFIFIINLNGILKQGNSLIPTFLFLSNFLLAALLQKSKNYSGFFLLLLLGFTSFFAIQIINGENPNTLFLEASRNWISIVMLTTAVLYYIESYKSNLPLRVFPSILVLIISIWAIGRAGILISCYLFLGILYLKYRNLNRKNRIVSLFVFSIILGLLIVFFIDKINDFIELNRLFNRFNEKGLDNSYRVEMIHEYINNLNFINAIFGYDYTNNPFFRTWEFNPHNSFIRLHYYSGIVGILFVCFLITILLKYLKSNFLYFLLLSVVLMRGFTDTVIFFGRYDFLVFYFVIDSLQNGLNYSWKGKLSYN